MLNPMEFGGFAIRRIAIRMLYPVGVPADFRYFLTLNL